jgi:peptidoglycan/LPS O-acetylase OafA/YrhL
MSRTFIPALTGLRGVAAIWVFLFHLENAWTAELPLVRMGYIGVDVFFILSGFILGYVHLDDFRDLSLPRAFQFIWLRLSRIYPVHFVTFMATVGFGLAIYFLGVPVEGNVRFNPEMIVPNLLLTQAWGWHQFSFNTAAWSISVEFLMYLFFPILAFSACRVSPLRVMAIGIFLLFLEIAAFRILNISSPPLIYAPLRIVGEFCCGIGLYTAFRSGRLDRLRWSWMTDGMSLAFFVAIWADEYLIGLAIIPALILGLARGRGMVSRVLSHRLLIILGEMSYSIYMVHGLALDIGFAPLNYSRLAAGSWVVYASASVAGAGLTAVGTLILHKYVEVPGRRWMRQMMASSRFA